jgi:hypothetical protein
VKTLIVICVIVLLLQVAALGVSFSGGGGDEPTEEKVENGWEPDANSRTARFEGLLDPFRPRIELPWEEQSFLAEPVNVEFKKGAKQRIAKFELAGGGGVMVEYACGVSAAPGCRNQTICLCPAGSAVLAQNFSACGSAAPRRAVCDDDGHIGAVTVYAETGTLRFTGLTPAGGTVRQR